MGAALCCGAWASHCDGFCRCKEQALGQAGFRSWRFSGSRAQTQWSWYTGWVALQHVESSPTRDRTQVFCIGGWVLYYWATREALCHSQHWVWGSWPLMNCRHLESMAITDLTSNQWNQTIKKNTQMPIHASSACQVHSRLVHWDKYEHD